MSGAQRAGAALRRGAPGLYAYAALLYLFVYAPVIYLVIFSFNPCPPGAPADLLPSFCTAG